MSEQVTQKKSRTDSERRIEDILSRYDLHQQIDSAVVEWIIKDCAELLDQALRKTTPPESEK